MQAFAIDNMYNVSLARIARNSLLHVVLCGFRLDTDNEPILGHLLAETSTYLDQMTMTVYRMTITIHLSFDLPAFRPILYPASSIFPPDCIYLIIPTYICRPPCH